MPTYYSNVDRGYRLELTLNQASQNISNNSSVVSYSLVLRNTINNRNNTFKSNTNTASLTINGSTVWSINSAPYEMMYVGTKTLASGNVTIGHNANGSKSFSYSASFDGTSSYAPQNLSLSGSMALTTIPRASKPTVSNSRPRYGNAITINTNRAATTFTHTITYKQGNSTGTIASNVGASTNWTIPISLISDIGSATSANITITVTTYSGSTNIGSESITITATRPPASKPTVSNSNPRFGNAITIYTNRASDTFTHTITYKQGNSTGTVASNVGTSTSWTIPISLINNLGSATSGKITITVTTYSGSINIGSQSITITATQPPPSKPTLSASSRNYGSSVTIYTNRSSSSYTHEIRATWNGVTGDISDSVGTSVAWTIPNSYMNRIPNAKSTVGSISVTTKYGSRTIGTNSISLTTTVPDNVIPKIDSTTATDDNTSVKSQFGDFVRTKSKLNATVSASGSYGSTIRSYRITFDGVVGTSSSSSFNVNNSGTRTINYEVTDSRGRKASTSRDINVLHYSPPTATITVDRSTSSGSLDANGTHARVSYNLSSWYVYGKNTHDLRFRYRVTGASSWTTVQVPVTTPSNPNGTSKYTANNSNYVVPNIGTESSYEFEALASDFFGTTKQTVSLPTGFTTMSFLAGGKGVAIGKVADRDGFEVAMPLYTQYGQVIRPTHYQSIDLRASSYDTNTWYPVTSYGIPTDQLTKLEVRNILDPNNGVPSWSTHAQGFTSTVAVLTQGGAWGVTGMTTYKILDDQRFQDGNSVGYSQMSRSSQAVWWLRGGGRYHLYSEGEMTWNIRTSSYTVSDETVSPRTSYPGIWKLNSPFGGESVAWGDVSGKPAQATRWPAWGEVTSRPANNQFPNTAQAIGGSQNLNNYTTPGFYFQNSNANAASGSNYPIAQAGTLVVTKDAGTTQMYYHYQGSGVYYRTFYSSTWSAWQNLRTPTWGNVSGKPAQATRWPSWGEVTSKPAQATRWPSWGEVTGKPSKYQQIWSGALTTGTATLSSAYTNFDFLIVTLANRSGVGNRTSHVIPRDFISTAGTGHTASTVLTLSNTYFKSYNLGFPSTTQLRLHNTNGSFDTALYRVHGVNIV